LFRNVSNHLTVGLEANGSIQLRPWSSTLAGAASTRKREEVIRHAPDIIIGSWCGKKFRPEKVAGRPGFGCVPAVKRGALHKIKSSLILQPGPAALTDGLAALQAIIANAIEGPCAS
jgi:iron complex transport system substrate-binding protein